MTSSYRDPDIEPGYTKIYLSAAETAQKMRTSRPRLTNLHNRGLFIDPDVTLGYTQGWDEERLEEFDDETGLSTTQGIPTHLAPVVERYARTPRRYLGSHMVAAVRGQTETTITVARRRGRFIPADIIVSSRFGWKEERVLQHSREDGLLTEEDIDAWAVTRAKEHKLPAYPDWVVDRIEGYDTLTMEKRETEPRPWIKHKLEKAGFPAPAQ